MDSTTMMVGGQTDDFRNMSIDAKDFKFGGQEKRDTVFEKGN